MGFAFSGGDIDLLILDRLLTLLGHTVTLYFKLSNDASILLCQDMLELETEKNASLSYFHFQVLHTVQLEYSEALSNLSL